MKRKDQRQQWLSAQFPAQEFIIEPASEDASFRSYFRVKIPATTQAAKKTYILMDAPPEHEDCQPFIKVLNLLSEHGINAPDIFAQNVDQGFLLLTDFGSTLYLDNLNAETANELYSAAIETLHHIQSIQASDQLPPYDKELLLSEMQLFDDWFIKKHIGYELNKQQQQVLADVFQLLTHNALSQPQVMVHRDFHSRNLMVTLENNPGVIDFQDAVWGPVTYDLASLLKDCYISWPAEQISGYCDAFRTSSKVVPEDINQQQFMRWFDLMAAQRHLKAIGIFCRLNYRDSKPNYLHDIPRTMQYLFVTAAQYPELEKFAVLLRDIQPKLATTV